MGNTKTYYIEGELLSGVTIEEFKKAIYDSFHATYVVAEIVEEKGGYLGDEAGAGPFLVAAIHSYSMCGDYGPKGVSKLFKNFITHRLDRDSGEMWLLMYGPDGFKEWKSDIISELKAVAPDREW